MAPNVNEIMFFDWTPANPTSTNASSPITFTPAENAALQGVLNGSANAHSPFNIQPQNFGNGYVAKFNPETGKYELSYNNKIIGREYGTMGEINRLVEAANRNTGGASTPIPSSNTPASQGVLNGTRAYTPVGFDADALERYNRNIANAANRRFVRLNSEGLYEVKVPGEPTRVFYTEEQALKHANYLRNNPTGTLPVSTGNTHAPQGNPVGTSARTGYVDNGFRFYEHPGMNNGQVAGGHAPANVAGQAPTGNTHAPQGNPVGTSARTGYVDNGFRFYEHPGMNNGQGANAPANGARQTAGGNAGQTVKVLDANGGCEYKGMKYATLADFRANNPDVSIPKAELAKVTNASQRKFVEQQKITNYRNAMKAQGMTGAELEEQVSRYKEGIKHDKKKAISKRKGEKIAKQKATKAPKGHKAPKGAGKIGKFFKGKGGRAALIGLGIAALGGIFALAKGCSENKPVVPADDVDTDANTDTSADTAPVAPAPDTSEETPAETPTVTTPETEFDTFKAIPGSWQWRFAERELLLEHLDEPDYKPSENEIRERTIQIVKRDGREMASDGMHTAPMLMVGDNVTINKTLAKLYKEAKEQLIAEHKEQQGYEPTWKEMTKIVDEKIKELQAKQAA